MLVSTRFGFFIFYPHDFTTERIHPQSGGEFGVYGSVKGQGLPGRFGVDYAFINKVRVQLYTFLLNSTSLMRFVFGQTTVDIFVDQEKVNTFRVTFLMERLCPLSYGLGKKFNETVSLSTRTINLKKMLRKE
jgi:hypothetical protein